VASVLGLVAAACCGLFAGAAVYINVVEHPARMSCGVEAALQEFVPSYKRAAVMQALLAVIGGAAGVVVWALGSGPGYVIGGLLLLAVVPFTLLVVLPTNTRLLDLHARGDVGNAEELLRRWNRLHAVRSLLTVAGFIAMLAELR
jgi:ABC-type Fe3+-siderophore transport system permease subunit